MVGWKELVLNLPGLPEGITEVKTTVYTDFFTQFEQSPIAGAEFEVRVGLDKKPNLYILDIQAEGWHQANCDRCLELIRIPVHAKYRYYLKVQGYLADDMEMDEDMLIVEEGTTELDLRPMVYESIVLALPLTNVYDCEIDDQSPCDPKILKILRDQEQKDREVTNPLWDVLKNIKFED